MATELNGTQASLLGFLHDGPRTGWELLQEIASGLGRFWNVTPSHAYRELKALEKMGLVAAGDPGPRARRPFRITAKGRKAFASWIQSEPAHEQIRFPLLVSLWFGEHLDPERLARFVEEQRRIRKERLAGYRKVRSEMGRKSGARQDGAGRGRGKSDEGPRGRLEDHPHRMAVVQFGIRYEEAILRWLQEVAG